MFIWPSRPQKDNKGIGQRLSKFKWEVSEKERSIINIRRTRSSATQKAGEGYERKQKKEKEKYRRRKLLQKCKHN